ncbi:MAG: flagellar filament capping protein FliD [Selenomonadaceae bacterium]|nr:flagellar filament capping protein FliD [Selenomonadaceae bacterium]
MGVNGIYGLSGSGLDIESMVKVGMMSKQSEYDKMAQKFTKNEWTKAAYLDVYSTVNTFNTSTLSQYKMSANMNAKTADSSSSAVKVSANASAGIMSHKVEVAELSSNAYLVGVDSVTRKNTSAQNSIKLADAIFRSDMTDNGDGTVTVDVGAGSTFTRTYNLTDVAFKFTLTDGTQGDVSQMSDAEKSAYTVSYTYQDLLGDSNTGAVTFNDLVSKINGLDTNIRASYDSVNDRFSFYNREGGKDNSIQFTLDAMPAGYTGYGSFGANESASMLNTRDFLNGLNLMQSKGTEVYSGLESSKDFSYNTQTKIFTNTTNGMTYNTGTKEYYDPNTNLSYKTTTRKFYSEGNEVQSGTDSNGNTYYYTTDSDGNENVLSAGSFTMPSRTPGTMEVTVGSTKTVSGTNGSVKVDGITYETTDNKVSVGGITYTALDKTSSAATVSVTQDTDAIIDKVKQFVEDYNKLLSGLYEKYDEKPNKDYKPLTQSQKDNMKDEQIEKWEEKAKAGLLYHDQTLGKIIDNMRSAISNTVEGVNGKYNSAYSIGISTTGIKGQLVLDETKLKNALAEDSDAVYNVFAKLDNNDEASGNGIAQRLGDVMVTAAKNIRSKSGSSADITEDSDLNNLLRELQTKMSNFKKLMSSFEDKLYKKYDAMEVTLAKLGTQLNFVLGGNQ